MKKEHMTCIRRGEYAPKDCRAIQFRGALDTLDAHFAYGAALARERGDEETAQKLYQLRGVSQKIMAADVSRMPLMDDSYMGMPGDEIHELSHNPKRLGVEHMLGRTELSPVLAYVNLIRTAARTAEREAVGLFVHGEEIEREDILQALNRLSSALYVLMCQIRAGEKERET